MLIAWLSTLAFAGCPPLSLDGTLPTVGATNVAVDQPVMVVVPDGPCAANVTLALLDSSGQPQVLPSHRSRAGASWVYRAANLPLEADTDYTLSVFDGANPTLIPFRTGQGSYVPPGLSLSITGTELVDSGDGFVASIRVSAETPRGHLLHFTGAMVPEAPAFAVLSEGATVDEIVQAQVIDDIACVSVRAESVAMDRTPWVRSCELVEPPEPIHTGTPPEVIDTGTPPVDTYYDWYGYYGYGYYDDGPEFVLFSCGGCQSTPGSLPLAFLPIALVAVLRRR